MKKAKKLLCVLLAAIMLLGVCASFTASAAPQKISFEKLMEATTWWGIYENCEAEMRSLLLPGKDIADFEQWRDRLADNVDNALQGSVSIEGGMLMFDFDEPELIEEAQSVYTEFFGADYAAKCVELVGLIIKSYQTSGFNYKLINLLFIGFLVPSRAAALLSDKSYKNQNGVYDAKAWSDFAPIREAYINTEADRSTIDGMIQHHSIVSQYNEAAAALLDGAGIAATLEAIVLSFPSFIQFFLKPVLKMVIRISGIFKMF